jgi:hypothetical protein
MENIRAPIKLPSSYAAIVKAKHHRQDIVDRTALVIIHSRQIGNS